jgi:hypothetical protein
MPTNDWFLILLKGFKTYMKTENNSLWRAVARTGGRLSKSIEGKTLKPFRSQGNYQFIGMRSHKRLWRIQITGRLIYAFDAIGVGSFFIVRLLSRADKS